MTVKVLITGAEGMLGRDVVDTFSADDRIEFAATDIGEMDITRRDEVREWFARERPDVCLHLAAYTLVDKAEEERDTCYKVNVEGTRHLAEAAAEAGTELIYISTDYVFNGKKETPYVEDDPTDPVNYYGLTKRDGEYAVRESGARHKIVRVSWLCGPHGKNFIETICRLGRERDELSVVNDQRGCPTFTFDLARTLRDMLFLDAAGIFHVTNTGVTNWHGFAREIFDQAGIHNCRLNAIPSSAYPTPAKRPVNSVLKNTRLSELGIPALPYWKDALKEYFIRKRAIEKET